jgi:DNA mismatch endonuclease (patch repair protein)
MDKLSPGARSRNMSRIRSQDTSPEIAVRSVLHRGGLRYVLHKRDLPGKPDIVFPRRRACIFVHGCFWHGCPRCVDGTRRVKSNVSYWSKKVAANRARDATHIGELKASGWTVFVLWECEVSNTKRLENLAARIKALPVRMANKTKSAIKGAYGRASEGGAATPFASPETGQRRTGSIAAPQVRPI